MNGMNNSSDDVVECPLCMEPLEVDDLNFYPCTCGYQICRFCWHRIRTDENELCPACRKEYPENPADFTPLTQEEMIAFKSQKRQRDQQRKQKITENRKHLSNVRVVQRNLVFVVGLPPRLADADVLKKHEYFGKFGKIHKVVINPSTTYAGVQGPSASAYVTYVHNCDALRAIQSVNNIMIDGRLIKTSLGTTKYCSHFMKNQQCPKGDCMYLHELGDPEASFTKEEMHQGKHQEYEKRLHDALIATSGASTASSMGTASNGSGSIVGNGNNSNGTSAPSTEPLASAAVTKTTSNHSSHSKNGDCNKLANGNASSLSSSSVASTGSSSMSTSSTSSTSSSMNSNGASAAAASGQQPKDGWPSLSESPVNNGGKEAAAANGGHNTAGGKSRREKSKQERSKHDKNGRNKNRNGGHGGNSGNNHNSNNSLATTNKENQHPHSHTNGTKETHITTTTTTTAAASTAIDAGVSEHYNNKTKSEKSRTSHRNSSNQHQQKQQQQKDQQRRRILSADEEVKLIQAADKRRDSSSSSNRNIAAHCSSNNVIISDEQRSLSTSSNNSSSDNTSTLSESTSGKSSPSSFPEPSNNATDGIATTTTTTLTILETTLEIESKQQQQTNKLDGRSNDDCSSELYRNNQQSTLSSNPSSPGVADNSLTTTIETSDIVATPSCNMLNMEPLTNTAANEMQHKLSSAIEQISSNAGSSSIIDTTAALSKLNIFDDNNSFFSSAASFQQSLLLKNKLDAEMRQNQLNSVISSHLPDLLNGIDGYQSNTANTNEWEEAFKNVMRNNKQMEDQLQHPHQHQPSSLHHQHQHQQHQQHLQQQEEFLRIQELQKRNNLLNNIGMPQMNGPHNDFPNNFHGATDLSRLSQTALIQHQQQMLQQHQERLQQSTAYSADHLLGNSLFGTNMSKFFDFHKTQQQIHQQQFMVNGHGGSNSGNGGSLSDHLRMASLLENNRINSQFLDKPPNGLLTQQQQQQQQQHQLQKQRLLGSKYDPILPHSQSQQQQQQQQSQTALQHQQNRIPNQFSHNSSVEDDLGFDPFIETQKALAELMENEMVQQQNTNTAGSGNSSNSTAIPTKLLHQQQQQQHQQLSQQQHQQQLLDNMQRARMPPPGFNHMNAFGFGVPRAQNSSKILPFMNGGGGNSQPPPQQPQMQMQPNSWNPHMSAAAMQQHTLGEAQLHMNSQQQNQNSGNHSKGYNSSNDWTAMDPAILSFRQFSSFPQPQQQQQQPPQQPPMPHHPQQDLFMQHLTQQQQQQQNGFGNQSQLHGSINLQNAVTLLNPQNTAAQVNLSHSNWLSSEQSLFMNSLTNGFTNNNFDKFSIPMPPGIHPNNLNKQQKTECIN